jgi:3-hydroxyisobutyrate dehydrogenase
MTIGYVGLGNMGGPLARRIQSQHRLKVWDMSAEAVQRMVDAGSAAAGDLADLGDCDIVLLCLPTSDHVRQVIFGDSGLAEAMKPGSMIVDQTSGDPMATRAMAQELAAKGIELIDAPVSGGPRGANAGTIAIMVGASDAQFQRINPILTAISPNVFHAGGVGTGHVAKLANNMISGAQRLVTMEAVALAVKNGITPEKACEIIMAGSGKNFYLEHFMQPHIIKGRLNHGFTLGLLHKDVRLACKLGDDTGVTMFFGNTAKNIYQDAINEYGADEQVNAVALLIDRMSGTHVVPPDHDLKK